MGNVSKIISQNKKYAVDVYRKDITEWDENEQFCVTEYTVAVSEKQAINQVRHRVKQKYGWHDHDNRYGSATTRFIFIAKEVIEEKKPQQLSIFDFDFSDENNNSDENKGN